MRVDYSARSGGLTGGYLFEFVQHRGDSNEHTQYTIFNMNKKNTLNYPKSAAMGFFPRDSRMISKQPFEPLEFYCICKTQDEIK